MDISADNRDMDIGILLRSVCVESANLPILAGRLRASSMQFVLSELVLQLRAPSDIPSWRQLVTRLGMTFA
jgi:hypothetical protein